MLDELAKLAPTARSTTSPWAEASRPARTREEPSPLAAPSAARAHPQASERARRRANPGCTPRKHHSPETMSHPLSRLGRITTARRPSLLRARDRSGGAEWQTIRLDAPEPSYEFGAVWFVGPTRPRTRGGAWLRSDATTSERRTANRCRATVASSRAVSSPRDGELAGDGRRDERLAVLGEEVGLAGGRSVIARISSTERSNRSRIWPCSIPPGNQAPSGVDSTELPGPATGRKVVWLHAEHPELRPHDIAFLCEHHADGLEAVNVIGAAGHPVHHVYATESVDRSRR